MATRRILYIALAWCFLYLLGRIIIVRFCQAVPPCWEISVLFLFPFLFALAEILWSREAFRSLEDVGATLVVTRNKGSVQRWYRKIIRQMYDPSRSLATALGFLPLLLLLAWILNWNSWIASRPLRFYDTACQVLMALAMASSQWPFANISFFIARLPRKQLSINFYSHRKDGIMSLGSLLLRIDLGGLALTSFFAGILYLAPVRIPAVVLILLIGVFLWAGVWFFLTQLPIHKCMMNEKRARLKPVSERLMASMDQAVRNPSLETQASFDSLQRLYDEVRALPEWPFRTESVLTLASGIVVPIALSVLSLLARHP